MRLICPNCAAQYEVPDEVIPVAGRDVQCSECGHTWFQTREGPEESMTSPEDRQPSERPSATEGSPAPDTAPVPKASEVQTQETSDRTTDMPAAEETEATIQNRRLDPQVAELLREEAERESRARAAESQPLESQAELGLDDGSYRRTPETEADEGAAARVRDSSRGSLLPDIEEINRDLSPAAADTAPAPRSGSEADKPKRRSGFSRGFAVALLVGVLVITVYAQADRIAAAIPPLTPLLSAYVTALDALRLWAYENITALLQWIEGLGG